MGEADPRNRRNSRCKSHNRLQLSPRRKPVRQPLYDSRRYRHRREPRRSCGHRRQSRRAIAPVLNSVAALLNRAAMTVTDAEMPSGTVNGGGLDWARVSLSSAGCSGMNFIVDRIATTSFAAATEILRTLIMSQARS